MLCLGNVEKKNLLLDKVKCFYETLREYKVFNFVKGDFGI